MLHTSLRTLKVESYPTSLHSLIDLGLGNPGEFLTIVNFLPHGSVGQRAAILSVDLANICL